MRRDNDIDKVPHVSSRAACVLEPAEQASARTSQGNHHVLRCRDGQLRRRRRSSSSRSSCLRLWHNGSHLALDERKHVALQYTTILASAWHLRGGRRPLS